MIPKGYTYAKWSLLIPEPVRQMAQRMIDERPNDKCVVRGGMGSGLSLCFTGESYELWCVGVDPQVAVERTR